MVRNLLNIFMEHDFNTLMIFAYNVLLAISIHILVLLMTAPGTYMSLLILWNDSFNANVQI